MVRRRRVALLALIAVSGCELGSTVIPRTDPTIVVHSVLNPAYRYQQVLVESSLIGAVTVVDSGPYDPVDPIVNGNGVPISGAVVTLTDPDGVVMTAIERSWSDGRARGIYEVVLDDYSMPGNPMNIQPGKRYHLSVSALGVTVTGSTLVPDAPPSLYVTLMGFNRDHDRVAVSAGNIQQARAFWLRLQAPVWPFSLITPNRDIAIEGNARNFFTEDLIRVFYPGFQQRLTVAAVDSNVYDYYRSGNDPFSGTGLISRLSGGLGLFGSVVVFDERLIEVTQDPTGDPIEDRFTLRDRGASDASFAELQLYLAAMGSSGKADRISGRHYTRIQGAAVSEAAIYGTRMGDSVHLDFLNDNQTNDRRASFTGILKGDSLIGGINGTEFGRALYVRAGK